MIKINKLHIDKFKMFNGSYHFMIEKGVWISFDKKTLEYIGNTLFCNYYYQPHYNIICNMCEEKINKLIALDILEVFD